MKECKTLPPLDDLQRRTGLMAYIRLTFGTTIRWAEYTRYPRTQADHTGPLKRAAGPSCAIVVLGAARSPSIRGVRPSIALFSVALLRAASGPPVDAPDYPAKDARYHSYPEMVRHIKHVAAVHPTIVRVFSIGASY